MLKEVQRIKLSGSEIWKKSKKSSHSVPLKIGDIVFVKGSVGSTTSYLLGIIVELTNTTAVVQTVMPTGQKSKGRFLLS